MITLGSERVNKCEYEMLCYAMLYALCSMLCYSYAMKTFLEFVILCSNRRLKIKMTARQKSVFPRCRRKPSHELCRTLTNGSDVKYVLPRRRSLRFEVNGTEYRGVVVVSVLQVYNQYCTVDGGLTEGEGGLYLLPAQTKLIPFQFVPQPEDVGKELTVREHIVREFTNQTNGLLNFVIYDDDGDDDDDDDGGDDDDDDDNDGGGGGSDG